MLSRRYSERTAVTLNILKYLQRSGDTAAGGERVTDLDQWNEDEQIDGSEMKAVLGFVAEGRHTSETEEGETSQ